MVYAPRDLRPISCWDFVLTAAARLATKPVKIYPAPASTSKACKDPVAKITESQLAVLDPKGERKALFDYRRNTRSVKPGDIVRVTFKNGDPFNGVVLSIKLRGIDTSFLVRNELTRVGVEMSIKVFSPNVQSVEIVQRAERKPRRARLYYMRFVNSIFPPRVTISSILLTRYFSTGPASTTAAAWRTLWPLTFARSGLSWVASASSDYATAQCTSFSIFQHVLLSVNIECVSISRHGFSNRCILLRGCEDLVNSGIVISTQDGKISSFRANINVFLGV